jgi:hypothetical protein
MTPIPCRKAIPAAPATLLLAALLAAPSFGARLAYEGFEYSEANGTALSALTTPGGTGWDGAYGSSLTGTTTSVNLQDGLAYTGFVSAPLSKSMRFGSSNTLYRPWSGSYATPDTVANGTYWYSFLYKPTAGSRGGTLCPFGKPGDPQNGFGMRMDRGSDVGGNAIDIRFQAWGDNGGGGTQTFSNGYGLTYLILGKAVFNSAGTSTNTLWIYQNPTAPPTVEPTTGGISHNIAAGGTASFRTAMTGRAFSTAGNVLDYDEFRVGDTFAEVFPATFAEFSVTPASAVENRTLTFNWSSVPGTATAIELDPGDIDLLPLTTAGAGSTTLPAPAANTTYTLTYTVGGIPTSVDKAFTALPPSFTMPSSGFLGDTLTLNWLVPVGSTGITLNPGAVDLSGLTSGTTGAGSTTIPAPAASTNYTIDYTYAGNPFTLNQSFTLSPPFLAASPEQVIEDVTPVNLSWRIDPAFSSDPNPFVTLEYGPVGGPYNNVDVTSNTNTTTGAGSYLYTPTTGEAEFRILYNLPGGPQVLSDTVTLFPKIFTSVSALNNTKPVQVNAAPMNNGVLAYSDRGHVWAAVPSILEGAQFVKFGQDDKATANLQVTFTAATDATFFLLLDNRIGDNVGGTNPAAGTDSPPLLPNAANSMAWVLASGFVDSGVDIGLDENPAGATTIDQSYSVYFRQVASGETFTFFQQNDTSTGGPGGRNMYGIAGVAPQVVPVAFVANPVNILAGANSTLQWTVPVGSTVSIDQGVGDVTSLTDGGTGVGSLAVSPSATTTYTLTYDPPGAGTPPVSLAPFIVTVNQFTATPAVITAGESSTLNVLVPAGSTAVTINPGAIPVTIDGAGAGSVVVSPTANTTYTLLYTAPSAATPTTAGTRTVTVNPATPFVITSVSVAPGGDVSFSWPAPAGVTDPLLLTDTVERSTTLSGWTDITGTGSFTIVAGVVSFTDTNPPAGGKAFYRIVRP